MLVLNRQGCVTIKLPVGDLFGGYLYLETGLNQVDDKQWSKAKENRMIQIALAEKFLEEVPSIATSAEESKESPSEELKEASEEKD